MVEWNGTCVACWDESLCPYGTRMTLPRLPLSYLPIDHRVDVFIFGEILAF